MLTPIWFNFGTWTPKKAPNILEILIRKAPEQMASQDEERAKKEKEAEERRAKEAQKEAEERAKEAKIASAETGDSIRPPNICENARFSAKCCGSGRYGGTPLIIIFPTEWQ